MFLILLLILGLWLRKMKYFSEQRHMIYHFNSEDVCLRCNDTTIDVSLQVDASQVGLDAVLLQGNKPLTYASKVLTTAEARYDNIEDTQTIVSGYIEYHHYLYGRKFVCKSDHHLLEKIQLKYLSDTPPRLQWFLLKVQPYDFEVRYIPGKEIELADAFSKVNSHERWR